MTFALRYLLLGMALATVLHYAIQPSIGLLVYVFWVGHLLGLVSMGVVHLGDWCLKRYLPD